VSLSCVIIDEHQTASALTALLDPGTLGSIAQACALQLSRDVAGIYGGTYAVRVGASFTDVQPGEMVFALLDSLPDAPGAIAYHDVAGAAVPVAYLALSTCSTVQDVSTAISHELCETAGDAACDLWADDGQGHEWARELCDAVESNSYPVTLPNGAVVFVSDFLLPAFFAPAASAPYSFLQIAAVEGQNVSGLVSAPFAVATGGYQIQRVSGTNEVQVTGKVRALRAAKVADAGSRASRRGAHCAVEKAGELAVRPPTDPPPPSPDSEPSIENAPDSE
jgi:hypothetical protein